MTGSGKRDVHSRFHPQSGPRSPSVANRALRAPAISALVGEPRTIGRAGDGERWNLGERSLFPPDERRALQARAIPRHAWPRGTCHRWPSRPADDVARSGVLVVWELALLALASGSRRWIRKGGGGRVWCVVWCAGTQSRAVVFYLLGASSERAENPQWQWRGRGAREDGRGVRVAGRASFSAGARLAGSAGMEGKARRGGGILP